MSQSDDSADDPQLKSLRAVWLSMPDEDPPNRGLDALMAAARAQAEVFATPHQLRVPWWKRALHALARPPVLALATIMILVGGAVLISKRDDIKEAGPAATSPVPAVVPTTVSPPPPPPPDKNLNLEKQKPVMPAVKQDPAKPLVETKPPAVDHHNSKPTPPVHRSPELPKTPAPKPGGEAAFQQGDVEGRLGGNSKTGDDTLDAKTAETSQTRAPTPKQVIVDQLIVQCRAAATRGDCEEAKLIARRIAAQSTTYYKEHVANDATIQKCIVPAANAVSQ